MEKFYREAEYVFQFNGNSNIVSVYDYFYANNTAYLAMEYLSGITLENYIKNYGALSEAQTVYIADKLSMALVIIHSAQILHRDISPDNIMLCRDGRVKLIDFGAARIFTAENLPKFTVIMKSGFTPIEQYQINGDFGEWTDIYSLGAVLYYGLTGKVPPNPYERIAKNERLDFGERSFDSGLCGVIEKAAGVSPEERCEHASELRNDIAALKIKSEKINIPDDCDTFKFSVDDAANEAPKRSKWIGSTIFLAVEAVALSAAFIAGTSFNNSDTAANLPANGIENIEFTEAIDTAKTTGTAETTDTEEAINTAETTDTAEAINTAETTDTTETINTTEAINTTETAETAEAINTAETAKTAETINTTETAKTTETTKAAETTKTEETTKTAETVGITKNKDTVKIDFDGKLREGFNYCGAIPVSQLESFGGDVKITVDFVLDTENWWSADFMPVDGSGKCVIEYLSTEMHPWVDKPGWIFVNNEMLHYNMKISREGIEKLQGGSFGFETYCLAVKSVTLEKSEISGTDNIYYFHDSSVYKDYNVKTVKSKKDDGSTVITADIAGNYIDSEFGNRASVPKSAFLEFDGDVLMTIEMEHSDSEIQCFHITNNGAFLDALNGRILLTDTVDYKTERILVKYVDNYWIWSPPDVSECSVIVTREAVERMDEGLFFSTDNMAIKSVRLEKADKEAEHGNTSD